jgi:hypothetical protein
MHTHTEQQNGNANVRYYRRRDDDADDDADDDDDDGRAHDCMAHHLALDGMLDFGKQGLA